MQTKAKTLQELLIECANDLQTFTVEELTIHSWKKHPEAFGLKGHYFSYPCSKTVESYFYGKRGIIKKGFVRKGEDDRFEYTKKTPDIPCEPKRKESGLSNSPFETEG